MADQSDYTAPATRRERPPAAPGGGGNMFSRKYGPLPGWAWAAVFGVGAVGFLWLRNRSAKASASTVDTSGNDTAGVDYSGELSTIQSEVQQLQGTAGTSGTSGASGSTATGTSQPTAHQLHVLHEEHLANTGQQAAPTANPVAPTGNAKYVTITVKPYTGKDGPWQSTLSTIAAHYHVPGGAAALAKLNGIQDPNLIHPGDRIKVPVT